MMRLLYPLVASALVTIAPFLLTFEKGQDIIRGLFGYSELALLLLFVWVKGILRRPGCSVQRETKFFWKKVLCYAAMVLIALVMVAVAFADLSNLLAIKGWGMGWFWIVPVTTCALAITMVWRVPSFSFPTINLILFAALVLHLTFLNNYAAQPLAQFPVVEYLARTVPKPVERKVLPEDFKARYEVVDTAVVTSRFVDSARSNVIVLVESWGIPLANDVFESELGVFRKMGFGTEGAAMHVGAHSRMYSRTRTAEREDLMHSMIRDSVTRARDTTFLPNVYAGLGFHTTFLFGGDSSEQWRHRYIRNVGFENVIFGSGEETFSDSVLFAKVDSLLDSAKDSLNNATSRQFIAITTRDTKFPLPGFNDPYSGLVDSIYSVYTRRLFKTLTLIAELARKHPEVRFVLQGDHEPVLSPLPFQERFYKRWVPYVVLN